MPLPFAVATGVDAAAGVALPALASGGTAASLVATYLVLDLVYSHGAENVPLVDVFLLSAGFPLRVLLGCALVAITPSSWLLLCASMPFVSIGILDSLRISQRRPEHIFPVDLLLSPRVRLATGLGWLAAVLWSLGLL